MGEIGTGDLEGVEEETGTAGVDVVRGDTSENLAEGVLDAVSTAGYGKLEPVAPGLPLLRIGDGSAGVVMVVAKFFSAVEQDCRNDARQAGCAGRSRSLLRWNS